MMLFSQVVIEAEQFFPFYHSQNCIEKRLVPQFECSSGIRHFHCC